MAKSSRSTSGKSPKSAGPDIDFSSSSKSSSQTYDPHMYTFHFSWWLVFGAIFFIVLIVAGSFINQRFDNSGTTSSLFSLVHPDNGDQEIIWNRFPTTDVELSSSFTITQSGTYHLTGTLPDGQITIDSGNISVRLILDHVTMHNSTGPVIYSVNAEDLVIETVGENHLSDGADYATEYDDTVKAVIFSKNDLTFQGGGSLFIEAHHSDGIVSKDDLKFTSGTYNIAAPGDTVHGSDSVYIVSGDFALTARDDAIESTNDSDSKKGFIFIENGNFALTSAAKAIKSARTILIRAGTFMIKSQDDAIHSDLYTGIIGGDYIIKSGDDGLHADKQLILDGGNIYIDAAGDGLDSNEDICINGGYLAIDGPTNDKNGALDYESSLIMNGGTAIAVGSSGMTRTLGSTSSILNVSIYFPLSQPAGTLIEIRDSAGETIISHTSAKTFTNIVAGSPAFKLGEAYTLYLDGEESRTFTLDSITTTLDPVSSND